MAHEHTEPPKEGGEQKNKIIRWIGIGSSLLVVALLIYSAFNLGRRDASNVPVIAALEGDVRTAPESDEENEQNYSGLEVNGVLEGETPEPSADVSLAPQPIDLSSIAPADGEGVDVEGDEDVALDDESANLEEDVALIDDDSVIVDAPANRPQLLMVHQNLPVAVDEANTASPLPEETQVAAVEEVAVPATPEPEANPVAETAVTNAEQIAQEIAQSEPETPSVSTASVAPGTPLIQLAANGDPQTTRNQWAQLQSAHSDVLGNKSLYVEKAEINGKTWYRLRVTGFGSKGEAQQTCDTLMSRGVDCLAVAAN